MRWLDSLTDSMNMNLKNSNERVKDREAWCVAVHGVAELDTNEATEHASKMKLR